MRCRAASGWRCGATEEWFKMAAVQRVPSGALLNLGMFDDEFDAVMAAAMEADPTVWKLDAPAPVTVAKAPAQAAPVQATAANAPACVVAPSAAARCVDQTHCSPCPWCVRPLTATARLPSKPRGVSPGPSSAAPADAATPATGQVHACTHGGGRERVRAGGRPREVRPRPGRSLVWLPLHGSQRPPGARPRPPLTRPPTHLSGRTGRSGCAAC